MLQIRFFKVLLMMTMETRVGTRGQNVLPIIEDDSSNVLDNLRNQVFPTDEPTNQHARSKSKRLGLEAFGMNMAAFDYGCHCTAVLSGKQAGIGKPVDPLDSVCKDYLGCMRCVKKQTSCQRQDIYNYVIDGETGMAVECTDAAGSCARNQCECDAKFFKDVWHLALSGLSYDFQYTGAVFDPTSKCKIKKQVLDERMDSYWSSFKQESYAQCCGGNSRPMEQFNTSRFSCCSGADGKSILRRRC